MLGLKKKEYTRTEYIKFTLLSYICCLFTLYMWELLNSDTSLDYSLFNIYNLTDQPNQTVSANQPVSSASSASSASSSQPASSASSTSSGHPSQPVSANQPASSGHPSQPVSNFRQTNEMNRSPFSNQQQFKTGNPTF